MHSQRSLSETRCFVYALQQWFTNFWRLEPHWLPGEFIAPTHTNKRSCLLIRNVVIWKQNSYIQMCSSYVKLNLVNQLILSRFKLFQQHGIFNERFYITLKTDKKFISSCRPSAIFTDRRGPVHPLCQPLQCRNINDVHIISTKTRRVRNHC